jgi:hypothetical protein
MAAARIIANNSKGTHRLSELDGSNILKVIWLTITYYRLWSWGLRLEV